jgi:hypothetical protein
VATTTASRLHTTTPRAVSAYVTHGVFPKESWNKFKADNGGEAVVVVTGAAGGGGKEVARARRLLL